MKGSFVASVHTISPIDPVERLHLIGGIVERQYKWVVHRQVYKTAIQINRQLPTYRVIFYSEPVLVVFGPELTDHRLFYG